MVKGGILQNRGGLNSNHLTDASQLSANSKEEAYWRKKLHELEVISIFSLLTSHFKLLQEKFDWVNLLPKILKIQIHYSFPVFRLG